jgi:hypothetical protein
MAVTKTFRDVYNQARIQTHIDTLDEKAVILWSILGMEDAVKSKPIAGRSVAQRFDGEWFVILDEIASVKQLVAYRRDDPRFSRLIVPEEMYRIETTDISTLPVFMPLHENPTAGQPPVSDPNGDPVYENGRKAEWLDYYEHYDEGTDRDVIWVSPKFHRHAYHEYELDYYAFYKLAASDVTSLDTKLPIRPQFAEAIVYYVSAMAYGGEMFQTDQNTVYFANMYNQALEDAETFYKERDRRKHNVPNYRSRM